MNIKYIDNQTDVNLTAEILASKKSIAIDLEFDKNHYRYGFNLCLIQLFDKETCYLIDPIGTHLDLTVVYALIEDPKIEKVCFAFGEDMRLLHHLGCFPKNVNDLATVRSLLDFPPLSLSNMLKEVLGMETDKKMQKSNWIKRPLSSEQITYAAEDVLYLFDLKEKLFEEVNSLDRLAWVKEENQVLDTITYPNSVGVVSLNNNEKKLLTAYQWYLLEGLMYFREDIAKEIGKPSYQVIHKDILKGLATDTVSVGNWKYLKGIYRSLLNAETQKKIANLLTKLKREAAKKEISKTDSAVQPLDRSLRTEFRRKRSIADLIKKKTYDPIKEAMVERYGSEFSTFVMPNGVILDLSMGNFDAILSYRKALIKHIGETLGIQVNY